MHELKKLLKYPCCILFGVLIAVISLADIMSPDAEMSELENRVLNQSPKFNLTALISNSWTGDYGEYMRDQFLMRDGWMRIQRFFEKCMLKLELGGVWTARDGYLIAKPPVVGDSEKQILQSNIQAVRELGERYPGKVYVMLVPSALNIMENHLLYDPPRYDENALMDDVYRQLLSDGIKTIDLRDDFSSIASSGSQVFYRTDHHWTTDIGAFTAYENFCRAAGRETVSPMSRVSVPDFYGSNYSKALSMDAAADELIYYDFPQRIAIEKYGSDGAPFMYDANLMDKDKLQLRDKYSSFLHGNNGYTLINGVGQGPLVIIKDSFGNSFAPFLINNYKDIGVVDLRSRKQIDGVISGDCDILVLYSFLSFTQDSNLIKLDF
jgi:hypothetical protein